MSRNTTPHAGLRHAMSKRLLLLALFLILPASPATAQITLGEAMVDRVVAVVGDSVVLHSQIEEEIQRMRLQQAPVPPETDPAYAEFFDGILESWVNRVLVLRAAAQDTLIRVDAATIEGQVSAQIDELTESFGGRAAFVEALSSEGLTLAEYRDILTMQGRQQQTQAMYIQSRMRSARPLDISDDDLRARFAEAEGMLQQRPRLLTFSQVVIVPEASQEARDEARALAEDLLARIRSGEDFEQLARRYSQDPGSAQLGGDLGWFRRGRMVREFEDVAFALNTGSVSQVVESDFGYHIIKVERARPGERQGRHILIIPEKSQADVDRARDLAEGIADAARAGASMDSLYLEHSDLAAPDSLTLPFDQLRELPPAYTELRTAEAGQVIGPLEYPSQNDTRFAIVRVDEIREAGQYTFEDVRAQIASQLQQERQLDRIIEQLRQETYIQILR
jgi:peptidyl-prolyl cis-trans isomerase SurA